MPIVRDGEKFACKQCIQGHRVSGCNHIDRPLQHVNKKGRPVSQCPHCRGLRRSRQTHIKCDCGERRLSHSRNTSSESASLDEDGFKCKCSMGKKCLCALKKEPDTETTNSPTTPSSQRMRDSPMRLVPPGRSESAIPRYGNIYQPQAYRTNHSTIDLGMQLHTHRPYQLGNHHNAQRSVDSLSLSNTQYQAPPRNPSYNHQFLNPEYSVQQLHMPQPPRGTFNDHINNEFPSIHLDQTTIDKTLSPHNTKRYSMNDFSMLAGMSQHMSDQRLFPHSAGSEPQTFHFQDFSSHDFAFSSFDASAAQNPPPQSVASTEFTFPALSRSSSGTTSEPGDISFVNPAGSSPQPVITIDPTWGIHNYDGSDKSNYEYTPASYHDTASEYSSPFDDPSLSMYEMDSGSNNGVNPFSTEPPSGGMHDFPHPSQDYNHGEARNDYPTQGLPDRSARNFSSTPQSALDLDFRFPNHEVGHSDGYSSSPLKQGWSPMTECTE